MKDNEITDEELKKQLDDIENSDDYKNILKDDLKIKDCDDLLSVYLNEIGRYNLLTENEENIYSKNIHIADNLDIVTKSKVHGCMKIEMNLVNVFASFINISCYDEIIDIILAFYKQRKNDSDKKVYSILRKYKKESSNKNRALSMDEISKLLNVDLINTKYLNGIELYRQIKRFILYKESYDKMFYSNLRLVVSVAKLFPSTNDFLDNIDEGNIGLMKAIDLYNPELGYKFSTYATWWIRQKIIRSIHEKSRLIRYPVHISEFMNKVHRMKKKYLSEFNRVPTIDEISKELNLEKSKVQEILRFEYDVLSFSIPVGEDDDSCLGDFIGSEENVEDSVDREFLKVDINILLNDLDEKERDIIKMRFGIDCESHVNGMTLQQIANKYGVTRERIRQIESKALRKLRGKSFRNHEKRSMKEYLV